MISSIKKREELAMTSTRRRQGQQQRNNQFVKWPFPHLQSTLLALLLLQLLTESTAKNIHPFRDVDYAALRPSVRKLTRHMTKTENNEHPRGPRTRELQDKNKNNNKDKQQTDDTGNKDSEPPKTAFDMIVIGCAEEFAPQSRVWFREYVNFIFGKVTSYILAVAAGEAAVLPGSTSSVVLGGAGSTDGIVSNFDVSNLQLAIDNFKEQTEAGSNPGRTPEFFPTSDDLPSETVEKFDSLACKYTPTNDNSYADAARYCSNQETTIDFDEYGLAMHMYLTYQSSSNGNDSTEQDTARSKVAVELCSTGIYQQLDAIITSVARFYIKNSLIKPSLVASKCKAEFSSQGTFWLDEFGDLMHRWATEDLIQTGALEQDPSEGKLTDLLMVLDKSDSAQGSEYGRMAMREPFTPSLELIPSGAIHPFLGFACHYDTTGRDDDFEDVRDEKLKTRICDNPGVAAGLFVDGRLLSLRIPLASVSSEQASMIVTDLCTAVENTWGDVIAGLAPYYEELLEKDYDLQRLVTQQFTFDIRMTDDGSEMSPSITEIRDSISKEIEQRVKKEFGENDDPGADGRFLGIRGRNFRRNLQDTYPVLVNARISSVSEIECTVSSANAICYQLKALVRADYKSEEPNSVLQKMSNAVTSDQDGSYYFSNLDGLEGESEISDAASGTAEVEPNSDETSDENSIANTNENSGENFSDVNSNENSGEKNSDKNSDENSDKGVGTNSDVSTNTDQNSEALDVDAMVETGSVSDQNVVDTKYGEDQQIPEDAQEIEEDPKNGFGDATQDFETDEETVGANDFDANPSIDKAGLVAHEEPGDSGSIFDNNFVFYGMISGAAVLFIIVVALLVYGKRQKSGKSRGVSSTKKKKGSQSHPKGNGGKKSKSAGKAKGQSRSLPPPPKGVGGKQVSSGDDILSDSPVRDFNIDILQGAAGASGSVLTPTTEASNGDISFENVNKNAETETPSSKLRQQQQAGNDDGVLSMMKSAPILGSVMSALYPATPSKRGSKDLKDGAAEREKQLGGDLTSMASSRQSPGGKSSRTSNNTPSRSVYSDIELVLAEDIYSLDGVSHPGAVLSEDSSSDDNADYLFTDVTSSPVEGKSEPKGFDKGLSLASSPSRTSPEKDDSDREGTGTVDHSLAKKSLASLSSKEASASIDLVEQALQQQQLQVVSTKQDPSTIGGIVSGVQSLLFSSNNNSSNKVEVKPSVLPSPAKSGISRKSDVGDDGDVDTEDLESSQDEISISSAGSDNGGVANDAEQSSTSQDEDATMDGTDCEGDVWAAALDASSGDVYYYNRLTNETTWDKPKGYREPKQKHMVVYSGDKKTGSYSEMNNSFAEKKDNTDSTRRSPSVSLKKTRESVGESSPFDELGLSKDVNSSFAGRDTPQQGSLPVRTISHVSNSTQKISNTAENKFLSGKHASLDLKSRTISNGTGATFNTQKISNRTTNRPPPSMVVPLQGIEEQFSSSEDNRRSSRKNRTRDLNAEVYTSKRRFNFGGPTSRRGSRKSRQSVWDDDSISDLSGASTTATELKQREKQREKLEDAVNRKDWKLAQNIASSLQFQKRGELSETSFESNTDNTRSTKEKKSRRSQKNSENRQLDRLMDGNDWNGVQKLIHKMQQEQDPSDSLSSHQFAEHPGSSLNSRGFDPPSFSGPGGTGKANSGSYVPTKSLGARSQLQYESSEAENSASETDESMKFGKYQGRRNGRGSTSRVNDENVSNQRYDSSYSRRQFEA